MSRLSFRVEMEQFSSLLDMCRIRCREVGAVPFDENPAFGDVTVVRGVACSFEQSLLQKLVRNYTHLCVHFQRFKNWWEVKSNKHCLGTNFYSALWPEKSFYNVNVAFDSAIAAPGFVHEPILLQATWY